LTYQRIETLRLSPLGSVTIAKQFTGSNGAFVPCDVFIDGMTAFGGRFPSRLAKTSGVIWLTAPEPRTIREIEKTNAKTRKFSSSIILF
jgi:hypothetical protein